MEKIMSKSKSAKNLATKIMEKLINEPFPYLLKKEASLYDISNEPQFRFMHKDKLIAINCNEEGHCMVGVIDKDNVETAKGFSEKLSILMYMMYEDLYINGEFDDAA